MSINRKTYCAAAQLKNGQVVAVRAVRPDDKDRFLAAFRELEADSIYTRLFTHKAELTDDDLRKLTEPDFESEVALVVTLAHGGDETVIGGGRYYVFATPDGHRHAEVAFLVEEDFQGLGMAGMILQHLVTIARDDGIRCFEAEVLPVNKAMLRVFARSGLPIRQQARDDSIHVSLTLDSP